MCLCGVRRGPHYVYCRPGRLSSSANGTCLWARQLRCRHKYFTHVFLQTALRVWDALLSEGGKVLYRVALALLRAAEPDLVAQDNAGDVLRVAKAAAAAAHDRDALMKVCLPAAA